MARWWLFWSLLAATPGVAVLASLVVGMLQTFETDAGTTRLFALPVEQYTDRYIWHVALFTLKQALLSSIASLVVGVLCALSLLCRIGTMRNLRVLLDALVLCFVLPPVVVVFGVLDIFGYNGVINNLSLALFSRRLLGGIYGLGGIVTAHVFYNAPLVAYVCLQRLHAVGVAPLHLAVDLQFSFAKVLRHVLWPCMRPALGGLGALVFTLCLTSFTVVLMLGGGPRATTLSLAVFEAVRVDFDPARAAFLSLLQVLLSLTAFLLLAPKAWQRLLPAARASQPFLASARIATQLLPRSVRSLGDLATFAILLLPLLVVAKGIAWGIAEGIAEGIIEGITWGILKGFTILTQDIFLDALLISLALGAASALVCYLVAVPLLWSLREGIMTKKHSILLQILHALALYPLLAVPPVVVAAALFFLLYTTALYRAFPLPVVFVCLVLVNGMLALPVVVRFVADAFFALAHDSAHLWDSLKLSPWRRWRNIDLPAVVKSLKAGLACAFCISLGDLSAIALFGQREIITLPYLAYLLMGRYRWQEASVCVAFLVIMYFLIFRLFAQGIQSVAGRRARDA